MTRMTARDFPPALLELYDGYVHGRMNRRQFLDRAGLLALGGMSAVGALAALTPNYALAQQVKFTDPDIVAEYIRYPSPNGHGEVRAYRVRPAKPTGKLPGVVVVHENRGLNPYIEDVARRVAKAGFIALAPDGLSSVGGYPGNDDKAANTKMPAYRMRASCLQHTSNQGWLLLNKASTAAVSVLIFSEEVTSLILLPRISALNFCSSA